MSPFRSSKGRSLGKLIEGFKSSTIGQGFGSGGTGSSAVTSGGVESENGGYKYHTFISPGAFTVGPVTAIDILAVGGGGAGGSYYGAGGGGGGVVTWLNVSLVNVPQLEIVVGEGGGNTSPGTNSGSPGGDTTVSGWSTMPQVLTAKGGGGGSPNSTQPGGSGGGRGSVPGNGSGGTGIQPQQNGHLTSLSGFNQYGQPGGSYTVGATGYNPAGGGGAGQAGESISGTGSGGGGAGGNGVSIPEFRGPEIPLLGPVVPRMGPNGQYYGGGGSGGPYSGTPDPGGYGGGGNGHPPSPDALNRGTDMLGGGGGGRHPANSGSMPTEGGDGIVIIRYQP